VTGDVTLANVTDGGSPSGPVKMLGGNINGTLTVPDGAVVLGIAGQADRPIVYYPGLDLQINAVTDDTYTLQASDSGKIVEFWSNTGTTVTCPNQGLDDGFHCSCVAIGTGDVTFAADEQSVIQSLAGKLKIAGQFGRVELYTDTLGQNSADTNPGTNAVFTLSGDLAS
jgi:hypothetical protein